MANGKDKLFEKIYFLWKGEGDRQNESYTTNIINDIKLKMLDLLATEACKSGKLIAQMRRTRNYLHTFWKQLFCYRNDGEYTIDNFVAEHTIRNMTIQRKNNLFFYRDKGARNFSIYIQYLHFNLSTDVVSFMAYFGKLKTEPGRGRTNYEPLLPKTVGL